MTVSARQCFDFESYLRLEGESPVRHEFLNGEVWAMAGGSPDHSAIAATVITLLHEGLRGRQCRVFTSDLRVRVSSTGLTTYPDASVICGKIELDPEDPKQHTALNPTVLVEVLSPTTEKYDRGEKLSHYKRIPALREILLVAQDPRLVEVWLRGANGDWTRTEFQSGDRAQLTSIGCELGVDEIFRDPLA